MFPYINHDSPILRHFCEKVKISHILTAIREAALAEPNISKSFMQYICDIQQEAEANYMLVSHDMHENESYLNEMDKKREAI